MLIALFGCDSADIGPTDTYDTAESDPDTDTDSDSDTDSDADTDSKGRSADTRPIHSRSASGLISPAVMFVSIARFDWRIFCLNEPRPNTRSFQHPLFF